MHLKSLFRFIHSTPSVYSIEKSLLAILRKKTGYTLAECKKALEWHRNDIVKAEQWLKERAQALGWSKPIKMGRRVTRPGLVGLIVQNNIGAMVEVNCETDLLTRNLIFRQFVESVLRACIQYVSKMTTNDVLSKIDFCADTLKVMPGLEERNLGDELALLIGSVGEIATLRRATCFKATNSITLVGATHPEATSGNLIVGKYGSMVAFRSATDSDANVDLVKDICHHIIGMNPMEVGIAGVDEPNADKGDEKCLINQKFLWDPAVTVGMLSAKNKLRIFDFVRFECSEDIATIEEIVNLATSK